MYFDIIISCQQIIYRAGYVVQKEDMYTISKHNFRFWDFGLIDYRAF